jgi:hypothetical protein
MRRPRMVIRALMITVAVFALLIGGEQMRRRRAVCLGRAGRYAKMEGLYSAAIASWSPDNPPEDDVAAECRRLLAFYMRRRRGYERAALCPWLPVPSEPDLDDPQRE